ncbi:hypothetical protein HK100_012050, partial [Physocladia obscura]
ENILQAAALAFRCQIRIYSKLYHGENVLLVLDPANDERIVSRDLVQGGGGDNRLSNLAPSLKIDNLMKSTVKLITRIDPTTKKAVVFRSREVAAEVTAEGTGHDAVNISGSITAQRIKKESVVYGYTWKDASIEDIDKFFQQMGGGRPPRVPLLGQVAHLLASMRVS